MPNRLLGLLLGEGGRATLGEGLGATLAGLLEAHGEELLVLGRLSLGLGDLGGVLVLLDLLAAKAIGGDEALNLGSLGLLLASRGLELAAVGVDVLANVVILGEREELADLGRALGTACGLPRR